MFLTENRRIYPLYWALLTLAVLVLDYWTGPHIQFPLILALPVMAAAWFNGFRWGLFFALLVTAASIAFLVLWEMDWSYGEFIANGFIRLAAFVLYAYLVDLIARQNRELQKEIKILQGILPICSYCKRIRDDDNNWSQMEVYITRNSEASFTHGICPDCARKYFGDYFPDKGSKDK